MGAAHYRQRPIFGPMLGLGRTTGGTDSAEFGCRPSPVGRMHRHPKSLTACEDAIGRFRDGVRIVDVEMRPKCSPGRSGARWDGMLGSTDQTSKARTRCSRMGSVTGCGRRQLMKQTSV